jgi:hypothetical protein
MKIKNLSKRIINIMGIHPKIPAGVTGGAPFRLMIPALATMEFDDADFELCKKGAMCMVDAGVLEIVVPVISKLTETAMSEEIEKKANVKVDPKVGKAKLQKVASKLGVEV